MDVRPTSDLVRTERFDFWNEVVCRTLVEGDCLDVARGRPFHGEISLAPTPEFMMSRVRSVSQRFVRTPRHVRAASHESLLLLLQCSGSGLIAQDGREVLLQPGDFTFTDSTRPKSLKFASDFDQLVVLVPRRHVVSAFGRTERLTVQGARAASPVASMVSAFLGKASAAMDRVRPATAERLAHIGMALIMTALGEFAATDVSCGSWTRTALLYRAKEFIEARTSNHDLNSAAVAAALGISQRYLQALFREEGTTPSEWIWHRRMEMSRRELADPAGGARNIADIALACGFADFAHFSHRFAAAYGMSPREFRALSVPGGTR